MIKNTLLAILFLLFGHLSHSCDEVLPLYNPAVDGERRVQGDSNMCYAFSISHALSAITGQYVNPLDVAYQFKELTGRGHGINTLDFQLGANPNFYNAQFFNTLLARGLCTEEIPEDVAQLLKTDELILELSTRMNKPFIDLSPIEQFRTINEFYRDFIDNIEIQCSQKERLYPSGVKPIGMNFSSENMTPTNAIIGLDRLLERGSPIILNIKNSLLNDHSTGLHSLVVIGRRSHPQTQACEYLLLDSSPREVCERSTNSVLEKDCEKGELWVSRERILKHGISLIGFRIRRL
ncbi:MAG: hypothetical protein K9K67_08075 [Bacteriovoracaceae bacterium]|nr:hypothetical protein [Bacteriovoracaceae bacterium]